MLKSPGLGITLVFCLLCITLVSSAAMAGEGDELQIRELRDISNRAIREQDIEAFISTLAEDYHVVTSSNRRLDGARAQGPYMETLFHEYPDALYVRTPTSIEIGAGGDTAAETGTWKGRLVEGDGHQSFQGSYFARWRKQEGRWKLLAEIFVSLD